MVYRTWKNQLPSVCEWLSATEKTRIGITRTLWISAQRLTILPVSGFQKMSINLRQVNVSTVIAWSQVVSLRQTPLRFRQISSVRHAHCSGGGFLAISALTMLMLESISARMASTPVAPKPVKSVAEAGKSARNSGIAPTLGSWQIQIRKIPLVVEVAKVVETQAKVVETQAKVAETQEKVAETQAKVVAKVAKAVIVADAGKIKHMGTLWSAAHEC